jgi:hypothetical protein
MRITTTTRARYSMKTDTVNRAVVATRGVELALPHLPVGIFVTLFVASPAHKR